MNGILKILGLQPSATAPPRERVYGGWFWIAYLANTGLMIAVSLMFRYSDYVAALGGDAADLGWITGLGAIGALAVRLFLGDAIDRLGAPLVWVVSMALYVVSLLVQTRITSIDGPQIYLVCFLMYASLAGAFGASITYVSLRAPSNRVTEVIGMLGSSGFVGMAVGPMLGDWIYNAPITSSLAHTGAERLVAVHRLLFSAAGFAVASLIAAFLATRGGPKVQATSKRRPPSAQLVRKYQPGFLLVVAAGMGIGIGMLQVFVRPFAEQLGVDELRAFFLTYSLVAFTVRLATRRFPEYVGEEGMIYLGLGCLSVAMVSFVFVTSAVTLMLPAVIAGTAHAFLFPAVVSSGCASFPARYRGLATTLVLAMFDFGNLVGRPALGQMVKQFQGWGSDGYRPMFIFVAVLLAAVCGGYYFRQRRFRRLAGEKRTSQGKGTLPSSGEELASQTTSPDNSDRDEATRLGNGSTAELPPPMEWRVTSTTDPATPSRERDD